MKQILMPALAGVLFAGALTTFAGAQTSKSAPTPKATQQPVYFGAADYVFDPNATTGANPHGNNGRSSYAGRFGAEIPLGGLAVMAEGDLQSFRYDPKPGTQYRADERDAKLGIGPAHTNLFIAASYMQRSDHEALYLPNVQGYGAGVELLPDFNTKAYSFYGSYYYYPQVGAGTSLQYHVATYRAGVELHPNPIAHSPFFLDIGLLADHGTPSRNSPALFDDRGFYSGLGVHF